MPALYVVRSQGKDGAGEEGQGLRPGAPAGVARPCSAIRKGIGTLRPSGRGLAAVALDTKKSRGHSGHGFRLHQQAPCKGTIAGHT